MIHALFGIVPNAPKNMKKMVRVAKVKMTINHCLVLITCHYDIKLELLGDIMGLALPGLHPPIDPYDVNS